MSILTEALDYVGGMSRTTKMPGWSYSIPAWHCIVGSKLRKVANSACSICYALKGNYVRFPAVGAAMERRFSSLEKPRWVECMVTAITRRKVAHFRWHDAGDLQSVEHLERIVAVARQTPDTAHWLPTRERDFVGQSGQEFPPNLCVRVSANMIDKRPGRGFANTSTIHRKMDPIGHECPASKQEGSCGNCRACWDTTVDNVSYPAH